VLGVFNILPPTRVCLDPKCRQQLLANEHEHRDRELVEPLSHAISIFTRGLGAVPGFSTSLYCRSKYIIGISIMLALISDHIRL